MTARASARVEVVDAFGLEAAAPAFAVAVLEDGARKDRAAEAARALEAAPAWAAVGFGPPR